MAERSSRRARGSEEKLEMVLFNHIGKVREKSGRY